MGSVYNARTKRTSAFHYERNRDRCGIGGRQQDGIAYVGDPHHYRQFEKLAAQQQINQQQAQAIAMDHNLAMGWYGAYGPYYGGMHHYGRYR